MHPDVQAAREAVRGGLSVFAHFSGFAGMNVDAMQPGLRDAALHLREHYDMSGHGKADSSHARQLDDAFVDRFGIVGPVEHAIERFSRLAARLGVVLPVSFFEKDGPHYYNSLAMVDADGTVMGLYRKSHIPDGPGYEEKFYFRPGDTGFRSWPTRFGTVGVGICWDQWFPECARAMMLQGAELLLYPTAIGSEPHDPSLDTSGPWQRAMVGHAVSNVVPVAAANRIGDEDGQVFYGHSFVADHRGAIVSELGPGVEGVAAAAFDLDAVAKARAAFGFFRDRRPDLYGALAGQPPRR